MRDEQDPDFVAVEGEARALEIEPPAPPDPYSAYRARMQALGEARFHLARDVAEALSHDVFATFFSRQELVVDPERWLLGGMRKACCHHLDRCRETRCLPDDDEPAPGSENARVVRLLSVDPRSALEAKLTLGEIVRRLGDRCREVIRLYRLEGLTAAEVADELDTTVRYAEKLIHGCMKRAKEICLALHRET